MDSVGGCAGTQRPDGPVWAPLSPAASLCSVMASCRTTLGSTRTLEAERFLQVCTSAKVLGHMNLRV